MHNSEDNQLKSDPTRPYCNDPYCWPGFFNPSPEFIQRLELLKETNKNPRQDSTIQ